MYAKAIYVDGKIVTGLHHGEAFSRLSDQEKCSDSLLSGFYDETTGRFFYDDQSFYTKDIYLIRHSRPSKGYDETIDPDLCEDGITKAHCLAGFLKSAGIADYQGYTSPFLRCLITADIISRMTGISFCVDPNLTEQSEYDMLLGNHAKDFPQFSWPRSTEFRLEKENVSSYCSRLKSVAEQLPNQAVVVTHYSCIGGLAQLFSGCRQSVDSLPMASVTHINNNKIDYFGRQV